MSSITVNIFLFVLWSLVILASVSLCGFTIFMGWVVVTIQLNHKPTKKLVKWDSVFQAVMNTLTFMMQVIFVLDIIVFITKFVLIVLTYNLP